MPASIGRKRAREERAQQQDPQNQGSGQAGNIRKALINAEVKRQQALTDATISARARSDL